jgi:hypothetical protein
MEVATVLTMVVVVVSVAAGVFCRYVLHRPLAGADEIATLGLVWLTFLGGAVAQRRHTHPRISLGMAAPASQGLLFLRRGPIARQMRKRLRMPLHKLHATPASTAMDDEGA